VCKNLSPALLAMKVERSQPYPMTIDPSRSYRAQITTSCGTMVVELLAREAPIAVNNFIHLAKDDFYIGQVFHRIDRKLGVIQAGDPGCPTSVDECGFGGPGYTIPDDRANGLKSELGAVGMASAGAPDSSGSQFFIVAADRNGKLPPRTIFGRLVGAHSRQVARLILSLRTKAPPGGPASARATFPDGEFVYILGVEIVTP
jgi:cyclophilin family peptidyl-prolyl cis-trans isomerase